MQQVSMQQISPVQFTLPLPRRPDLDSVHDRVKADDAGKWDATPRRREVALIRGRLVLPASYKHDCPTSLALTPWATSQLCQRLGIPTPYFRKCPLPLRDAQANHWLQFAPPEDPDDEEGAVIESKEENWLLRGRKDRLRGVLSSRYAKLDNAALLESLRPLLHSRDSRLEVKDFSLSEESLHLRLVDPALSREVLKNDRLFVGLHVSNSEVGVRSVRVDALVWRLVCSNGLIRLVNGRSLFHRRHVCADPDRFARGLQSAMAEAVTAGAGLLERLALATRSPVLDVPNTIRALSGAWGLSLHTQDLVTAGLLSEHASQQESLYGLVNAFTSAAHHLDPEERYRVEALAARLAETGVPRLRGHDTQAHGEGWGDAPHHNGHSRVPALTGGRA